MMYERMTDSTDSLVWFWSLDDWCAYAVAFKPCNLDEQHGKMQIKEGNRLDITLMERPTTGRESSGNPVSSSREQRGNEVLFSGHVLGEIPSGDREYVLLRNTRTGELKLERLASMAKNMIHIRPDANTNEGHGMRSAALDAAAAAGVRPAKKGGEKAGGVPDEIKHIRREDYEVFNTEDNMGWDPLDIDAKVIDLLINNVLGSENS